MKIAERMFEADGKIIIQETHDWNPAMETARRLRSDGAGLQGESRLVGVIDPKMWSLWAKEAGISMNDPDMVGKMKEVVRRKMMSGEFSKLRVWEGNY